MKEMVGLSRNLRRRSLAVSNRSGVIHSRLSAPFGLLRQDRLRSPLPDEMANDERAGFRFHRGYSQLYRSFPFEDGTSDKRPGPQRALAPVCYGLLPIPRYR